MAKFIPTRVFLTKGVGRHKERLASFEMALRSAQIERFNLVTVSSIFPPGCKCVNRSTGLKWLSSGEIVYCVLSRNDTAESKRLISAGVGMAIPADSSKYGYLSEHHGFGGTEEQQSEYVEDLAASMLATTLGVEFNSDDAWNEKKEVWKISGQIVKTSNVTQVAVGQDGVWTTVVAAAIFCR